MFDNVLFQSAPELLVQDINNDRLPGSILFSGPSASGKLTCALELARVLSCSEKANWNCSCKNCLQHKALVSSNVLVVGPGNRSLEIAAAKNTLLSQNANNTKHLEAARFLYLRAVRKLTVRFNPILWEGEDKVSKFSPILQSINENLEVLTPGRTIPDGEELSKITDEIEKQCQKLEDGFLYDSLPVSQIRNFTSWAHLSSNNGKKVLIIENADLMSDSSRNALLKTLEEPPEDTMFILTTTKKGAMLPTILSRVRTYTFFSRTEEQQQTVMERVFHFDSRFTGGIKPKSLDEFLQSYLPVKPFDIKVFSKQYFETVSQSHVPDIAKIVSGCKNFLPRVLFTIFLQGIVECQKTLCFTSAGSKASSCILEELRKTANDVQVYNQNPVAALERLTRSLIQINMLNDGIFLQAVKETNSDE